MANNKILIKSTDFKYNSYSLEGEDRLIDRYFKEKTNGFYVDIGSHHPYRFNNTYLFYKKGWRGINVDADEKATLLFNRYRKEDVNITAAVGSSSVAQPYYRFNDSALNTFDKKLSKLYLKSGYKIVDSRKVKFKNLSDILQENMYNGQRVDFMSIDVEGHELSVLMSNNWEVNRPEILLIEVLDLPNLSLAITNEVTEYLKSKEYKIIAKTLTNLIYKDDR